MGGAKGTVRAAVLTIALVGFATGGWAESREPLARFFDSVTAATARPAATVRRPQARPASPPPAPSPVVAAHHPAPSAATAPTFVVGVFGDAFAAAMARGLDESGGPDTGRDVVDTSADDASIAALDAATWDSALQSAQKSKGRLDAAVMLVGRDDGVPLADSRGQPQDVGSPTWRQLYGDRVAAVAGLFRAKHIPLIWVGLPIVRDAGAAQLYATLNEIVHDRASQSGATFIDSWQAFADENGDFSTTGPDVDGRPATLRWSNGWNFTRAGARKLASFVLPELRRIHDRVRSTQELAAVPNANPDSFDQALSIDVNQQILREAGLPNPGRPDGKDTGADAKPGPLVTLTAAPMAADGQLAPLDAGARSASLMTQGSHQGRADDFAWPRP